MEKVKLLSRKKTLIHSGTRGANGAYIPHQLPPKSQEPQEQKEDGDEANVVPSLPRKLMTYTASEVDARFRAFIAMEPLDPAPVPVEVKPRRIYKPRKKLTQSPYTRRSPKVPRNSIMPRLPVKIVRADNTAGSLVQPGPLKPKLITPKPKEPEVIPESEPESISGETLLDPQLTPVPESEEESISEDEPVLPTPTTSTPSKPTNEVEVVTVPSPLVFPLLWIERNRLQCEICGRVLNAASSKSEHKKTHNPPEFPCPARRCGMSFGRKFNLQRHQAKFRH